MSSLTDINFSRFLEMACPLIHRLSRSICRCNLAKRSLLTRGFAFARPVLDRRSTYHSFGRHPRGSLHRPQRLTVLLPKVEADLGLRRVSDGWNECPEAAWGLLGLES